MKKKNKKIQARKKNFKKENKNISILPVLFFIAVLSLFSETMRTIPAGAINENLSNVTYKLPKLNSNLIEKSYLNKYLLVNLTAKKDDYQKKIYETFLIEENFNIDKELIFNKKEEEIIVEKVTENKIEKIQSETSSQQIVDVPKVEETIKIAQDISSKTITVEGEEKLIPGSEEKNITYMQILSKPNDLDLNLKYAQQQGKIGNYKQTIATLERLNMLYPDNIEIKLYLLSVLVQADAPEKALNVIDQIKSNQDATAEDLETVKEIETELKERSRPRLWNLYADIGAGFIQSNNVNSVSKTRLQMSSDSLAGFNSPMHDRTYSSSFGLTATRQLGKQSSFMINAAVSDSRQVVETGDDFESYGLTFGLDTTVGNQSLSPYLMLSKTDYQDDADSFSTMVGVGGFFTVGERNSFSYGYSVSDAKGNRNTSDTTANETNAIGHGITLGHDYAINEIISTSSGLGYNISEAKVGANDFETYDFSLRLNLAFPWAYISIGDALSFNDYFEADSSNNSNRVRSDYTNTFDIMATKALGDFIPFLDPSKSFYLNFSYEKLFSEANIINYDYVAESFSFSVSKTFRLNK